MVSSLLSAIDIPELLTTTEADYEKLALDLATNPEKLKSLKAKLARNKDDTSLFNTEQFTGNIETAYTEMYSRYVNGKKPEHLLVNGHGPPNIKASVSDPLIAPPKQQVEALIALYNQGQFEEVITQATILVEQFPQAVTVYNILGVVNKRLHHLDAAIQSYNRAIEIKPNYGEAHYKLGNALKEKGNI